MNSFLTLVAKKMPVVLCANFCVLCSEEDHAMCDTKVEIAKHHSQGMQQQYEQTSSYERKSYAVSNTFYQHFEQGLITQFLK